MGHGMTPSEVLGRHGAMPSGLLLALLGRPFTMVELTRLHIDGALNGYGQCADGLWRTSHPDITPGQPTAAAEAFANLLRTAPDRWDAYNPLAELEVRT